MAARRALSVILVLLAIDLSACEQGGAPTPPASPPDLQLVSAGAEPRQVLWYRPAVGTKQTLEVTTDVELDAGEMGGPMPTMIMKVTMSVDALFPTGLMKIHATIDDVLARDAPNSKVSAASLAEPLKLLKGVAIDALLAPNGRLSGARVDRSAKQLSKDLDTQVASLVSSFEQTMMPLPEEPVGIGAVWRNSRAIENNGLQLTAVNSVSLTSVTGTAIGYTVETVIHGKDQTVAQGGMSVEVKDITGQGNGKGTIDLVKLDIASELLAEFRTTMSMQGDVEPTKMTMATLSKVHSL